MLTAATGIGKSLTGVDQSLAIITALLRLAEIENSRRSAGFGVVALDQLLREVYESTNRSRKTRTSS
jgi:hypothetical protein